MIGCGNIGSRLLQSLVRMRTDEAGGAVHIDVVEPSESARTLAMARALEAAPELAGGQGRLTLSMHGDMQAPQAAPGADLALITTTSSVRFALASEAIQRFAPKRIVFEKFLFPRRSEYPLMQNMLTGAGIEAWVHCSRNEAPGYHAIRALLASRSGPVHMTVAGGKIALASNAIHFLSLYNHLTGARATGADSSGLAETQSGNRREGYCELTGALRIGYADGGTLTVIDHGEAAQPVSIFLTSPEHAVIVDESGGKFRARTAAGGWVWEEHDMKMILASQLSGVFERILRGGSTTLPAFEQSAEDHLALIGAFNRVLAPDDSGRDYCPIT